MQIIFSQNIAVGIQGRRSKLWEYNSHTKSRELEHLSTSKSQKRS